MLPRTCGAAAQALCKGFIPNLYESRTGRAVSLSAAAAAAEAEAEDEDAEACQRAVSHGSAARVGGSCVSPACVAAVRYYSQNTACIACMQQRPTTHSMRRMRQYVTHSIGRTVTAAESLRGCATGRLS